MKALIATSLGNIKIDDFEVPDKGKNILIKTELASICGSDIHMAFSGWGINNWPAEPGHPGHEAIGKVIEGNSNFDIGDLVLTVPHIWNSKCFAEIQSVDSEHVIKINKKDFALDNPARVYRSNIENLLMSQQLGTVLFAAKKISQIRDKTCLVIGQGSAGLFWNYVLKEFGAQKVISVDPNKNRVDLSESFGADDIYNQTSGECIDKINKKYKNKIDLIIEAVGTVETINHSINIVKDSGEIVLFGLPETTEYIPIDFSNLFKNRVRCFTVFGAQDEKNLISFRRALDMIGARKFNKNKIDVSNILSHTFGVLDGVSAFDHAINHKNKVIKVGIDFR